MINNTIIKAKNTHYNYKGILILTIFYCATYSSSLWGTVFNQPIFNYGRYILLSLMVITFLYRFLRSQESKEKWAIVMGLLLFLIYNSLFHYGSGIISIVIFCAYVTFLNEREVIKSYTIGLSLTVLFVVSMSMIGILPKIIISSGFLTFGFGNPNSLGGMLAIIFMSYLYLSWKQINFWLAVTYVVAIIINLYLLNDKSAVICMAIYLFFYLIRNYINKNIFSELLGNLGILLPIVLTVISLILSLLYGKYSWIYDMDEFLTKRIYTWNYYLNIDGIHLFPHDMGIIKPNEYQLGFYGKNVDPLLRGFFDGGYMFMLLRMGLVNTAIFCTVIGNYFFRLKKDSSNVALELLLLILIFYTFTENEWIAPYGFCVSYLITIGFCSRRYEKL